jgi:Zn-dependent peptidase ImmA (M78 family)/DNA-binding XRE family transcriptional regulator
MTSLPAHPFNAARLRQARQRRGLTKVALGRAVGLTARRIAEYENEGVAPPPATVAAVAEALGFPPTFFFRPDPPDVSADNVSFRSFSRLAAGRRDAALSAAATGVELTRWLDRRLDLPAPDVSDLAYTEPEIAAVALRSEWGLGEDPMPNAIHLLEAHGVRVLSIVEDCAQLDAFSLWSDGVPFVFLTAHKSPERARWDAAHELGHLVLHTGHRPQGRQQEQEADAFAAALLLPRLGVLGQAPRVPSLRDIVDHKIIWRVSALAYIRRLHQLGAITDWHYRSLVVEASRAGYRREEGDIERETSKLVPAALRLLAEDGIGARELASQLDVPVEELRGLLFGAVGAPMVALDGGGERTVAARAPLHLAGG